MKFILDNVTPETHHQPASNSESSCGRSKQALNHYNLFLAEELTNSFQRHIFPSAIENLSNEKTDYLKLTLI